MTDSKKPTKKVDTTEEEITEEYTEEEIIITPAPESSNESSKASSEESSSEEPSENPSEKSSTESSAEKSESTEPEEAIIVAAEEKVTIAKVAEREGNDNENDDDNVDEDDKEDGDGNNNSDDDRSDNNNDDDDEISGNEESASASSESLESSKKSKKSPRETDSKPHKTYNALILVLTLLALICSGTTMALGFSGLFGKVNWATFDEGNGITFTEGTIAEVANRVSPSVVSILTETRVQSWYGQESSASAAGTGVIVSKDGYIITNKHVISDANKVSVVMDSGTTYDANEVEIVGTDPSNDIAFLKIKGATDLPYAALGDSKNLAVGQQVIAIGNALGMYQNTVTEGIVSGTGRTITASDTSGQNAERLTDMIQTDAAINAGNSGGPLVNAAGQVIGINTAVGSGNNLGFAIPISSIKGMLKTITETGKLDRAYLGVYYDSLTPQSAKQYNLDVTAGAYIHSSTGSAIIADSPAAKAGLQDGDVITRVNGAKVGTAGALGTLIGEYAPGDTVTLTIVHENTERAVEVTLASYPTQQTQQQN